MVCLLVQRTGRTRCLFLRWEQKKGDHFFFCFFSPTMTTATAAVAAAVVVRASLFDTERMTARADAREAHATRVPRDARKSNTLFLTGVLAVAKQRHEVHRVSATLTHEVIDDFFLSRRPDLSLPLFYLSFSRSLRKFRRALAPSMQLRLRVGRSLNQSAATRAGPLMSLWDFVRCMGWS